MKPGEMVYSPPPGTLHAAAAAGDVGALRTLLDGGADVNAADAAAAAMDELVPLTP